MVTRTDAASSAADEHSPGESGISRGMLGTVRVLIQGLHAVALARLALAALEAQRAGRALALILACGLFAGALAIGAWMGLMGALVLWLMDLGVKASGALLATVVVNLLGILVAMWVIRVKIDLLGFPATMQALAPSVAPKATGERP